MTAAARLAVLALGVATCVVAAMRPVEAQAPGATWRVRSGEVRVLCPLTVGGSFEARTTAVTGEYQFAASATEPGAGAFAVDLASLDTGIGLRNQHLRDTYLEVGKGEGYARAVLSQIRLTGVDGTGPSGKGRFSGVFALHGVERPVEGTVEVRRNGGGVRTRATFSVVLATFGIAAPRYLGVGVKDTVTVQVQLDADAEGSGR